MATPIVKYSLSLLLVAVASCANLNTAMARSTVKNVHNTSQAGQFKKFPHTDLEIANQFVNITGHSILQKRVPFFVVTAMALFTGNASAKPYSFSIYNNGKFLKARLALIFPFHHFW